MVSVLSRTFELYHPSPVTCNESARRPTEGRTFVLAMFWAAAAQPARACDGKYAGTAAPAYVDSLVLDYSQNPFEKRLRNAVCALLHMDPRVVNERLGSLEKSTSEKISNAAKLFRKRVEEKRQEGSRGTKKLLSPSSRG